MEMGKEKEDGHCENSFDKWQFWWKGAWNAFDRHDGKVVRGRSNC